MDKIYKCCICHKELKEKPHRLTHQEYAIAKYKQYAPVKNYDLCDKHFEIFKNWVEKHEK